MPRSRKRRVKRPPPGATPGTIVVDPTLPPPVLRVIQYGPEQFSERQLAGPDDLTQLDFKPGSLPTAPVTWIDVDGLGHAGIMTRLGEILGLHRLSVSDIVHLNQRPKAEDFGSYLFVVLRMPRDCGADVSETEQVSLCLGKGFVVTFQEQQRPGDCFEPVRKRIRESIGRIRGAPADYLAYALIDAVVDGYFAPIEKIGERLDVLEDEVMGPATPATLKGIHAVRRDLISMRRAVWPMREAIASLLRDRSDLIGEPTRIYLRDCHDHTVQIIDLIETYRDIDASIMDMYVSGVSQRLGEVMKVLTVITTIFIPLTFIVGIYGMNFDPDSSPYNMPELRWRYGYPAVLILMAALALYMLIKFRRKGWLGGARAQRP